jgi:hypothetical protein
MGAIEPLPMVLRLLLGELRTQTLLHDLRGSLGTALGWSELAAASGATVSPGLSEALQVMHAHLTAMPPWWRAEELQTLDLGAFVAGHTGLTVAGGPASASFRSEVLGPCLALAKPTEARVTPATDAGGGRGLATLHLSGLPPLGVRVACHPTLEGIERGEQEGHRTIATIALRCVARGGVGSIRSSGPEELVLNLRGGGNESCMS